MASAWIWWSRCTAPILTKVLTAVPAKTLLMPSRLLMIYLRSGFKLQAIDNKLYIAGEIVNKDSRHRNRNVKLQLLELSRSHAVPDLDVYITVDDWPQTSQENVNPACPIQGPILSQVLIATFQSVVPGFM